MNPPICFVLFVPYVPYVPYVPFVPFVAIFVANIQRRRRRDNSTTNVHQPPLRRSPDDHSHAHVLKHVCLANCRSTMSFHTVGRCASASSDLPSSRTLHKLSAAVV